MTNPNNAVGTDGAYGGRTSVNAFNDTLAAYARGIMSGWECIPNTGLNLYIGGTTGRRDVAIAEDDAGNKTTINNISEQPINITISPAPLSNSRIDLIVGYVDSSPQGTSDEVDNPGACGLIVVKGTVAVSPTEPDDTDIRTAITADGADGIHAYYVILASVTIASGTTTITSGMINPGLRTEIPLISTVLSEPNTVAYVDTANIFDNAVTASKIDFSTLRSVLYNNETGTTGAITLSESAANFVRLKIYYKNNTSGWQSVDVVNPNNKNVDLTTIQKDVDGSLNKVFGQIARKLISGTSITTVSSLEFSIGESNNTCGVNNQNFISITRVEGWLF